MFDIEASASSDREAASDTNALRSLEKARQAVEHLLEQKNESLEKAKSDAVKLTTENRELKEQLQRKSSEHNLLLIERDIFRAEVSQHENCEAEYERCESELRTAKQENETLKSNLKTTKEQNTLLRKDVESTTATFGKLKDAENAAKKDLKAKETEIGNVAKLRDEADKKLSETHQQLCHKEQQCFEAAEERDNLKSENKFLTAERNGLASRVKVLEKDVVIEKRNKAITEQENDALRARLEDAEIRLDHFQKVCADAYWVTNPSSLGRNFANNMAS